MRVPLKALSLDFENGSIHIPHALAEKSFTRMDISTADDTTTLTFEAVNPYAEEVRDFISLLEGGTDNGTTLQEAGLALRVIEAITTSYRDGVSVTV